MSKQSFNQIEDNKILLKYIIKFWVEYWRLIFFGGLLGILGSIGFLMITPSEYQATALIQMAQIGANNNTNPLGVNLEEPNQLIARLRLPSTYSYEVIKVCGFENVSSPAETLASSAKFSAVKGVSSMVELKINRYSRDIAIDCAQALFETIKTSQNEIIQPYIEESKTLLNKYERRLTVSQSLGLGSDKLGSSLSAACLANHEEVKLLNEEALRLSTLIAIANSRRAKLASPIFVADAPAYPKTKVSLIVGLIVGVSLSFLFVMGKKALE